ncbi:MAG TPA: hypothetical protein VNG93_03685 [Candidatus Dormibacteraeota bacterium]|nr:hypothetical protein [Candidatus Dormibacteraeota bacterium]
MNVARWVVRGSFLVQLLLGIGLWIGRFDIAKPVHIVVGVIFVLAMWTVAVFALRAGGNRVLGAVVVVWGVGLAVFGLVQESILTGGAHWVIQVLHLVVGFAAIGMTEALAGRTSAVRIPPAA